MREREDLTNIMKRLHEAEEDEKVIMSKEDELDAITDTVKLVYDALKDARTLDGFKGDSFDKKEDFADEIKDDNYSDEFIEKTCWPLYKSIVKSVEKSSDKDDEDGDEWAKEVSKSIKDNKYIDDNEFDNDDYATDAYGKKDESLTRKRRSTRLY